MSVEKLTNEKLAEYGFIDCSEIKSFLIPGHYNKRLFKDKNIYYASKAEGLIYTDIDAARKIYLHGSLIAFPFGYYELLKEYYEMRLNEFVKKNLAFINDELFFKNIFRSEEIETTKNNISFYSGVKDCKRQFEYYLIYLNGLDYDQIGPKIQNQQSAPAARCLPVGKIIELYDVLSGVAFNNLSDVEFITCFDIANTPTVKPIFINSNQNVFTYALSLIDGINSKIALSNFGIKNFDQMKGRPLPKSKRQFELMIKKIITISMKGAIEIKAK
ncbi:hypothetical protein [Mucilaginibacter sp. UR6-11]|uniref:hypothetical protein n=1 Tax=Mucilaginibacter sp. UR6-11 TaxID=1435644 RepID=UPI001E3F94F1|nr:hypothetical protein [Mucilaginibacter sp. UR6-11]MCC8426586.1 hypothetical protein [Mucilaginibacter sp. UR6-11]